MIANFKPVFLRNTLGHPKYDITPFYQCHHFKLDCLSQARNTIFVFVFSSVFVFDSFFLAGAQHLGGETSATGNQKAWWGEGGGVPEVN